MISFRELDRRARTWWQDLSPSTQYTLIAYFAFQVCISLAIWLYGPARIFDLMADWARQLREMKFGAAFLTALLVLTAFPPMLGYGTLQAVAGFGFGVWKGWLIGSSGCMIGAILSFVFCRYMIGLYAPMLSRHSTFSALSAAVRQKGTPLVIMIRLCPFPFPYSNAFFASIETVTLLQFTLATLATTPKLLIHAFIGQRTYMFADPDSRHAMDSQTKLLNGLYIALGSLLSAATSYYVYKLTMRQVELASTGAGAGTGGGGRAGQEVDLEAALLDDVDELLGQDARDQDQDGQDLDDDDDDDDEHSGGGTAGVRDHDHDRTRVKRLGRSLDRHDIVELDVLGDTTSKLDSDGRSGYQGHLERYRDEPQGAENGVGKSQAGQIGSGVGRMSEDRWDGSISDFGDHTEEQERRGRETGRDADEEEDDAEADDGWGLDMESIEEDGGVEHGSVADRLVSFAVEDDAVARPVTQKQRRD